MDETWFAVPEAARDRFAALYVPTPGGGLSRQDAVGASFLEPRWFSGGGGLSSTLADYVRFTRFLARRRRARRRPRCSATARCG